MARKYYVYLHGICIFESTSELVAHEYARLSKGKVETRKRGN